MYTDKCGTEPAKISRQANIPCYTEPECPTQVREGKEIENLIKDLFGAVSSVADSFEMLYRKLDPIMRPSEPTGETSAKRTTQTPLGNDLLANVSALRMLDQMIMATVHRIEI